MTAINVVDTSQPFLAHYGIKGMKWGVRRSGKKFETRRAKKKRVNNELKNMSDDQLQKRLNRLQNEDRYRQMTGAKKSKSAFRKSVDQKVNEALATALTAPVKGAAIAAGAYGTKLIAKHGKDAFNAAMTVYALNNLK